MCSSGFGNSNYFDDPDDAKRERGMGAQEKEPQVAGKRNRVKALPLPSATEKTEVEFAQWRGPSLREVRGASYSRRLESADAIRSPPARRLPPWKTRNARPSLGPRKRANWPRGRNLTFPDQKKRGRPRKRSRTLAGRLPRRRWMVVLMLRRSRCLRVPKIRTPRGASSKPRAPWAYDRHIYRSSP